MRKRLPFLAMTLLLCPGATARADTITITGVAIADNLWFDTDGAAGLRFTSPQTSSPTPEPPALLLLASGAVALGRRIRRQGRRLMSSR